MGYVVVFPQAAVPASVLRALSLREAALGMQMAHTRMEVLPPHALSQRVCKIVMFLLPSHACIC